MEAYTPLKTCVMAMRRSSSGQPVLQPMYALAMRAQHIPCLFAEYGC
ncbi:MAG: hypothetical protein WBB06_09465 [Chitinophagaceae bacterium]